MNKITFIWLALLLPSIGFAQERSLTYEEANDIEVARQYKNQERIYSYTTRNGDVIKAGDRLLIGSPVAENINYTHAPGIAASKLHARSLFNLITIGTYADVIGFGLMAGRPNYLPAAHKGAEVTVEYVAVVHRSLKRNSTLVVHAFVRDEQYELLSGRTILDLERALVVGEVINPSAPMTRQEAIAKLKETKDLVDLGLVSESEFNKLRGELAPIIMKSKQNEHSETNTKPPGWMIRKTDGSVHGPFTAKVVITWIQEGHIKATDEYSIDATDWQPFAQHEHFSQFFSVHPE